MTVSEIERGEALARAYGRIEELETAAFDLIAALEENDIDRIIRAKRKLALLLVENAGTS